VAGNVLSAHKEFNGASQQLANVAFDAAAHRYWRVREAGDEVF
jgi:hypothetical protein